MSNEIKISRLNICAKTVCIAEEHHHVILPWAELRRKSKTPFDILVLDHHTDVLSAGYAMNSKCRFDYSNTEDILDDIAGLHHDEHLDWAVRSGIAGRVFIVSHENFTPPANPNLKVICDPQWPPSQDIFEISPLARSAAANALESAFLKRQLDMAKINENSGLLLDIDLDYFLSYSSLCPKDAAVFAKLIRNAPMISISMERDWVNILHFADEKLDSEILLTRLLSLIQSFLS